MKQNRDNWLPSLEKSVPKEAYGYTVSMYSVALEGWRRGLTLKFINKNRSKAQTIFKLSNEKKEHYFSVTRGDIVPRSAIKICIDKHLTKNYMEKSNVPTPKGEKFSEDSDNNDILNYSNTLGYPLVIKPSDGTGGDGVIANIKNEEEFKEALEYIRHDLGYKSIIVERYFPGEDYRLYVIGGKVIGAFKKNPANVVGDGTSTIKNLLKLKNNERNNTPALYKRLIRIDKEMHNILRSKGYTLDSVPKSGERVFLKTKNNISAGGDSIDVTDELTEEIKDIAIRASKAIPGLIQSGVDIMVNKKDNTGVVLEVNSRPHITAHLYPWEGKARDIPKAIIDYYFPETIENNKASTPKFFFDFKSVFDSFQSGIAKEFTIPDIPKGTLDATRFIVSGTISGVDYERWVQTQARELRLNGYIKHLRDGKSSIVVAGSVQSINKFKDIINNHSPKRAKIDNVVQKARKSPIKVGFEIIISDEFKTKTEKNIANRSLIKEHHTIHLAAPQNKREIEKSRKETSDLQREKDLYQKKYENITNSRSWKLTKPFRKFGSIIRSIQK